MFAVLVFFINLLIILATASSGFIYSDFAILHDWKTGTDVITQIAAMIARSGGGFEHSRSGCVKRKNRVQNQ